MAAIGAIRKHGGLLVAIIGIALLAFLVGDLSKLTTVLSDKNTMLKVNGKVLTDEYHAFYQQNESLWRVFYEKSSLTEAENAQVHEFTWNQVVGAGIISAQLEELGLTFSTEMREEMIADMYASLNSQTPNPMLSQVIQVLAKQMPIEQVIGFAMSIEDYRDVPEAQELYGAFKAVERMNIMEQERATYLALAAPSLTFSDALATQMAQVNTTALTSFATLNLSAPAFKDIAPTFTDSEMKSWYKKHQYQFETPRSTRDIDVVVFPIVPSADDKRTIADSVRNQYNRFTAATSLEAFNINEMKGMVDSSYYKRADITIDTLQKMLFDAPVGTLIAPINIDEQIWYYGKSYAETMRPDSVLIGYLVVDYKTDNNPVATRTQEEAKATSDSLLAVLKAGTANIFQLTPSYLGGRQAGDSTLWMEDRGTFTQLYDSLLYNGLFVQELMQGGAFVVYQTLSTTAPVAKRRFALYTEEITPSATTVKNIRANATQILSESTNATELVENANKNGVQVVEGKGVTSMMANIGQLPNCRQIVSWAFLPNTEVNTVSDVMNLDGVSLAVAAVSAAVDKDDVNFEAVKEQVETEMVRAKKLEMVKEMIDAEIATNGDIKAIAQKFATTVSDNVSLTFTADQYQNRGIENEAIPAIFAATPNQTTVAIGKNAAYIVSVNKVDPAKEATATLDTEKNAARNVVIGRGRSEMGILQGLESKSEIIDQRNLFYSR